MTSGLTALSDPPTEEKFGPCGDVFHDLCVKVSAVAKIFLSSPALAGTELAILLAVGP